MVKKIAIIGGGIVGSTAAYYLARSGHTVQSLTTELAKLRALLQVLSALGSLYVGISLGTF